jgi:hypothetical protein
MVDAVEEKTHARKGPSGADTWAVCYGAPALCDGKPNVSSVYARWGTCAHEVAGLILAAAVVTPTTPEDTTKYGNKPWWSPENAEAYVGRIFLIEGHEVEFDMEMADCVNDYVAQVETYWEPGDVLLVEQAVPIDHITGEEGATGTSDCIIIKPAKAEIIAIDLKGGKGVAVYAEDNRQAAMYSDGAIVEHDLFHGPFDWVTSVITQPRLQSVSEHRVSREEHDAFVAGLRADAVISACADEDFGRLDMDLWVETYLRPGGKQCRFCNAKSTCPALLGEVTTALRATAANPDDFPDLSLPKQASAAAGDMSTVDAGKLAEAYRAIKLIESWIASVRDAVHSRLHDGQTVPGFALYEGSEGARAWSSEDKAEKLLKAARVKADTMYSKKLISYPQAEKQFKNTPALWAKLAPLVSRSPAKPIVASEGDPKKTPWSPAAKPEDFPVLDVADDEVDPFS